MKQVWIRADGGQDIGMGHLMRTSVLAEVLKERVSVTYLCLAEPKWQSGIHFLENHGFLVKPYPDQEQLYKLIEDSRVDLLITDSYAVDGVYLDKTKRLVPYTMVFDDNNELPHYNTDMILNQNIGAEQFQYNCNPHTKKLLGCRYSLLRKKFREAKESKKDFSVVKNILLTMGGADPTGATEKILELTKDWTDYHFHVVVGNAFLNQEKIKSYASETVTVHVNPDMFEQMRLCDIAISSCGSTIYELAALGVPVIGMVTADNQRKAAIAMEKNGLLFSAGTDKLLEKERFCALLREFAANETLLSYMSKAARMAVDGDGVNKIVTEICTQIGVSL